MRHLITASVVGLALFSCDSSSSSSSTSDAVTGTDTAVTAGDTATTTEDAAAPAAGDPVNGMAVATKTCATCHGADMKGGMNMGTCIASNLYELAAENKSATSIITTLRNGTDDEGQPLCSSMPKYPVDQLSDKDALDLATYLLSLK